jgi:valyl-tRNA synthetase
MFLNNTDDANAIPILDNEKYIFKIQDRNTNLLKFSKTGNMLVGNNSDTNDFDIPPTQRLEIIGNIHATGYIRSYYSDDRLKTFTSNITDALNIIDNLKGFHYVPNDKAIQLGFTFDNEIGLSAQDVQRVVPEIVKIAPFDSMKDQQGNIISKSGEGYLTICYERLGAVFVEAIKELRQENKKLKDEIDSIKKDLDNCKRIIYIQ